MGLFCERENKIYQFFMARFKGFANFNGFSQRFGLKEIVNYKFNKIEVSLTVAGKRTKRWMFFLRRLTNRNSANIKI